MKNRFFISLLALAAASCSTTAPRSSAPTAEAGAAVLVGAHEYTLHSAETGKTYRIQTARIGPEPAGGYPVLYVLDGDALFPVVAMAAQGMMMRAEENHAAPLLVVGVGYANGKLLDPAARAHDYTPPSADYNDTGDSLNTRFGGADAFHRFLSRELRADIKQKFAVNDKQHSLFGHSYGGLFGLYSLFNRQGSFRNYLIASPSIWWNNRRILQDLPLFLANGRPDAGTVGVRLSVGGYEQTLAPHLPRHSARQAVLEKRGMVRETTRIGNRLAALPADRVQAETVVYPKETHASVLMPAINDGLKWLFARCRADADGYR